jgi:hypothetical protein
LRADFAAVPEIAHNWISPVRIKVNASRIAAATASAAQSEDRSANQKTTFFDSIDPKATLASKSRSCPQSSKPSDRVTQSGRFATAII